MYRIHYHGPWDDIDRKPRVLCIEGGDLAEAIRNFRLRQPNAEIVEISPIGR